MFAPQVKFKEAADVVKRLIEGWNFVRNTDIYVGVTEDSNVGREGGKSNAEILYLNENGEPAMHIPPRPVLKPAIAQSNVKSAIADLISEGSKAAFSGDIKSAEMYYEKAGMVGRDACRNYITDGGNLAPNAASTIARKGSSTPLVDTGSLVQSISYKVRKKR